jgi:hypothetical protein
MPDLLIMHRKFLAAVLGFGEQRKLSDIIAVIIIIQNRLHLIT